MIMYSNSGLLARGIPREKKHKTTMIEKQNFSQVSNRKRIIRVTNITSSLTGNMQLEKSSRIHILEENNFHIVQAKNQNTLRAKLNNKPMILYVLFLQL